MSQKQGEFSLSELDRLIEGSDDYSEREGYRYLLNFLEHTNRSSAIAYRFCSAFESLVPLDEREGFPTKPKKDKKGDEEKSFPFKKNPPRNAVSQDDWDGLKKLLRENYEKIPETSPPLLLRNLMKLAEYLNFSDIEKETLKALFVIENDALLTELAGGMVRARDAEGPVLAKLIGKPENYKAYSRLVANSGKFHKYGIIETALEFGKSFPTIETILTERLSTPNLDKAEIVNLLLGTPAETDLDYSDFDYMGDELDYVREILKNASDKGLSGINILIDGPQGGGKTELSKALAKSIGKALYLIGEEDDINDEGNPVPVLDEDGDLTGYREPKIKEETTSKARLADLLRAHGLLEGNNEAIVLFDEIEDLLIKGTDTSKSADTDSKIMINRLLENNKTPTIWCGNDPNKFHPSVRQRFTHSIYVGHPPVAVRKKIWEKQLSLSELQLSDNDVTSLARTYDAAPRQIALAIKAAKITDRGLEAIQMSLEASSRITLGSRDKILDDQGLSKYFDPELMHFGTVANQNGEETVKRLIERGKNREAFALIAKGEQGTGLRSLGRYMAEELVLTPCEFSMRVLRQSSQFSSGTGNIYSAFAHAANHRAFLIINDLEHLSNNPQSDSGWDKSLIEAFVDAASTHKLPFAVSTTNPSIQLPTRVAALFSDELKLESLSEDQKRKAFDIYFGQEAPKEIEQVEGLVLADFADTRRHLDKLDTTNLYADDVVGLLARQMGIRKSEIKSGIGFGQHEETPPQQFIVANDEDRAAARASATPIAQTLK